VCHGERTEAHSALGASDAPERQRLVQGVGRLGDIERLDAERLRPELVVGAGVLGEHEHAGSLVQGRTFLRNEVHPVAHRVDEQDVVGPQRRHRARKIVVHVEHDGLIAIGRPPLVHDGGQMLDLRSVGEILR
jgi:hypothetical protein